MLFRSSRGCTQRADTKTEIYENLGAFIKIVFVEISAKIFLFFLYLRKIRKFKKIQGFCYFDLDLIGAVAGGGCGVVENEVSMSFQKTY